MGFDRRRKPKYNLTLSKNVLDYPVMSILNFTIIITSESSVCMYDRVVWFDIDIYLVFVSTTCIYSE